MMESNNILIQLRFVIHYLASK